MASETEQLLALIQEENDKRIKLKTTKGSERLGELGPYLGGKDKGYWY